MMLPSGKPQRIAPYFYELMLPEFSVSDDGEIDTILGQLDNVLRMPHVRLISYVMPLLPERFEATRRQQMAQLRHEIGRLYMEEEVRSISAKLTQNPSWEMRHYLMSWERPVYASKGWIREDAEPPEPLPGRYTEEADFLRPLDPGGKYVKVLGTYEFRTNSQWSWWNPFGQIIAHADGPMLLSLDAEKLSTTSVRLARRGLKNQLAASKSDDEEMRALAEVAALAMQANEEFYRIRLFVMLRDAQVPRLMERAERIRQTYETLMGFSLLPGQQAAAFKFFTEMRNPPMPTNSHHTVLASALPVAFGGLAGMNSRVRINGIYLGFRMGFERQSLGPTYIQGWSADNQAYHMGILGSTGGGKTVFVMAALAREFAINDTAIAFIDPMGNCPKLAQLLGSDSRARLHRITWKNVRINPMDYVGESDQEQSDHLHALFQTMLNRPLNNIELTLISEAARRLYEGKDWTLDDPEAIQAQTPLLADFCDMLRELHDPEADHMARELHGLYVSAGAYGTIFNARTNLDLAFDGATLYDVEEVAGQESSNDRFKTILYYTMLSSLIRTARRGKQGGSLRRRILAIDEYFYLSRNPYLAARMVDLIKTARNRGMGIWFCEQNLATFCGLRMAEKGDVDLSAGAGHLMMSNVPIWMVFKQADREAALVRREFPSRCSPAQAAFLPGAQTGQCVAMLKAAPVETHVLDINLLPSERKTLAPPKKTAVSARPQITTRAAAMASAAQAAQDHAVVS